MPTPQATKLLAKLKIKPENYWIKRGERMVLRLFHEMSARVPAYKHYLKKNQINPKKIKNISDLKEIPVIDKSNYLKSYPLKDLCWDGKLKEKRWVFSSTSGTTGEPFYFPREDAQDFQYALTAELYLLTNFQIDKKSTLYIDCFAMGVWIGGLFTYEAIKTVAEKGKYNLSIITPGTNKIEIIKTIKKLAPKFDQIILGGYPPFIKDLIDESLQENIDWGKYNVGIIFSAEGFSENFRDYIIQKAQLKNPFTSTLNHYGIVDLGTISYETPLAILVRRLAVKNFKLNELLFPQTRRLPTLTQYLPEMFYFENVDGNILCSGHSGLPLVRYDVKDRGKVLSFNEVSQFTREAGINLNKEVSNANLKHTAWNLPFVYVYERSDMVVSWGGANIYPEHIREVHLHNKISSFLTGKFTMEIVMNKNHNPILRIYSELKKNKNSSNQLTKDIQSLTIKQLLKNNSEYKILFDSNRNRMIPQVFPMPYESAPHFSGKGKQKWALKN